MILRLAMEHERMSLMHRATSSIRRVEDKDVFRIDWQQAVKEAENYGMEKEKIYYFNDRQELLEKLKNTMEKGDSILFKASNGMKLFEIVEKLK